MTLKGVLNAEQQKASLRPLVVTKIEEITVLAAAVVALITQSDLFRIKVKKSASH